MSSEAARATPARFARVERLARALAGGGAHFLSARSTVKQVRFGPYVHAFCMSAMVPQTPTASGVGTEESGELLLTPQEVARVLRITLRHVRRLAQHGSIQRVRLGARTVRYTRASIDALIDPPKDSEATGANRDLAEVSDAAAQATE